MKEYKVKAEGYWNMCYIKANSLIEAIKLGALELNVNEDKIIECKLLVK